MLKLESPRQMMQVFPITPAKDREELFDPKNQRCPFHKYVGNASAVRIAIRLAKEAFDSYADPYGNNGIVCIRQNPVRLLLTGPRSVGKTTFAKCYAELVGKNHANGQMLMPYASVDATSIARREHLLERIQQAYREARIPMIPDRTIGAVRHYSLPPSVLFIDEVHALHKKVMEGILKMTEANDGIFELNAARVDCRRIAIIVATTDPGKLTATLKSRFPIKIGLEPHSLDDLAVIIQNETKWPWESCMRLARLKPIPREALGVSRLIEATRRSEDCSVEKAMDLIATDLDLQDGCLNQRSLNVLLALADAQPNGLSKKNICASCDNMDESEFESEIMPQLLRNQFHTALVTVSGRHKITESGLDELRMRKLIDY